MGDPMGIGPEVIIKTLADQSIRGRARFVIYGLNELMTYEADQLEIDPFWFRVPQDSVRASKLISDDVVVLDFDEHDNFMHPRREPTRQGGAASKAFIESAITDAMRPADDPRSIDAIVTGPIS